MYTQVDSKFFFYRSTTHLCDSAIAIDRVCSARLEENELGAVNDLLGCLNLDRLTPTSNVFVFQKLRMNNCTIFSQTLKRVKRRNNYMVTFTDIRFPGKILYGAVQKYVIVPQHDVVLGIANQVLPDDSPIICGRKYPSELQLLSNVLTSDFLRVTLTSEKIALQVHHIQEKCILTMSFILSLLINENEKCD